MPLSCFDAPVHRRLFLQSAGASLAAATIAEAGVLAVTEAFWAPTHVVSFYLDQIPADEVDRGLAVQAVAEVVPTICDGLTLTGDRRRCPGLGRQFVGLGEQDIDFSWCCEGS